MYIQYFWCTIVTHFVNSTELFTEKSKVTFQDDRTTYHEVPEQTNGFHDTEPYDDNVEEYRDEDTYQDQDDTFREEREKFDEDQEQYQETDEQYQEEDSVFREEQERAEEDHTEYQPEQPKLTPKQRWHRAYNKIVMQLNVSTFFFITMDAAWIIYFFMLNCFYLGYNTILFIFM